MVNFVLPNKEDYEELEISQRILKILEEAKRKILGKEGFDDFDCCSFDVNIDLKVVIDGRTTRVQEKWKNVNESLL